MSRIRVGVVRGGMSDGYDTSLATGALAINHLPEERYKPIDIFIDQSGVWHMQGVPAHLEDIFRKTDVIFNALHGYDGEDGQVQKVFELHTTPYTGSSSLASALAFHKGHTKERLRAHDIPTPFHYVVREPHSHAARTVLEHVPPPYIVKPVRGGGSYGIAAAEGLYDLPSTLEQVFAVSPHVLVEQRVIGREATVGVIEGFRNQELYTLPPVEITLPKDALFLDANAKQKGGVTLVCPGNFSRREKELLEKTARAVHRALGLRHYSRTDFILSPRGIYVLEVNTLPPFTEHAPMAHALEAIGCPLPDFLAHLSNLALK